MMQRVKPVLDDGQESCEGPHRGHDGRAADGGDLRAAGHGGEGQGLEGLAAALRHHGGLGKAPQRLRTHLQVWGEVDVKENTTQ